MTLLPALFWFGYDQTGRGCVLQSPIFLWRCSSILPGWLRSWVWEYTGRPSSKIFFAHRALSHHLLLASVRLSRSIPLDALAKHLLAIGQHHLEYGFPSTHTTNCISIVLYLHTLLLRVEDISPVVLHVAQAFLVIYAITIVYGRLYCGMHSLTDCIVGTAVGAAVWGTYWAIEDVVELWVVNSGWYGKCFI